ncbi:hypothetical protein K439DRAFT_1664518 [Ramaria rubella]|nr:hypothetical protein K439DRAFT_1664518 [Ramaria rubella]
MSTVLSTSLTMIIKYLDPSIFFFPFSSWGLSGQGQVNGLTFAISNAENATITFRFSHNATAFLWRGFKRSGAALYSVCTDCKDASEAELVDGHALEGESTNTITTLFSKTDLTNSNHTVSITNLFDPRFGSPSQITLESFALTVPNTSPPVSSSSSNTMSITPELTSEILSSSTRTTWLPDSSETAAAYWTAPKTSTALSKSALVGTALAGSFALLAVIGLGLWFLRRNKSVYGKLFKQYNEKTPVPNSDPESPMSITLNLPPRNDGQASLFRTPVALTVGRVQQPPSDDSTPSLLSLPLYHSHNVNLSPPPDGDQNPTNSLTPTTIQWGTIPVVFNNPFASPDETDFKLDHHSDSDSDPEFDLDTPLPSSEFAPSFIIPARHASTSMPVISQPRDSSNSPAFPHEPNGNDEVPIPQNLTSRGWRRVK